MYPTKTVTRVEPVDRQLLCLPVQDVREGKRCIRMGQNIYKDLLADLKRRALELDPQTIAGHLLRIKDPKTGKFLADEDLLPEIAILFVAGVNHICLIEDAATR
jgi:hypothetical protein